MNYSIDWDGPGEADHNHRHPSILDHSPSTLRRVAAVCREASHDLGGSFDDLQDAANLLDDWASIREGVKLIDLAGVEYPLPE